MFCCPGTGAHTIGAVNAQTRTSTVKFPVLRLLYSDWKYTINFPGSPVYNWHIMGLLGLHNCVSQFLTINPFLNKYVIYFLLLLFSCKSCLTLWPHELQHARLPSPSPGVGSSSWPLKWWCHPIVSSSAAPFSSCPQSFPASESLPMSQLFTSGGQSIGASASPSILPMLYL